MGTLFLLLSVCPLTYTSVLPPLDPDGANVCRSASADLLLSCCAGWRQQGNSCSIAVCAGARSCRTGEMCVRPGECRCPHGYFGANCVTRCPDQFWGPDCRESCPCHPHGKCDATSGRCTCNPDRWGPGCGRRCACVRGRCEARNGQCRCEAGWWGADCSRPCHCHPANSLCDPGTGHCNCSSGYWGKRCNIPCYCGPSPCTQRTGECQCGQGWWGALCDQRCLCHHGQCHPSTGLCTCLPGYQGRLCSETCAAGLYGQDCRNRCGHCKEGYPCSPVNGSCILCEGGWKGDRCDQLCAAGSHGSRCTLQCPMCGNGAPCHPHTGHCASCNPGWTGPRCDTPCVSGTYGTGCRSYCADCYHGTCHHVTGECVCDVGYTGHGCNSSCPAGTHGVNCSMACSCLGTSCHQVTGRCHLSTAGVVTAAVLLPLLLLLLLLCALCCCCGRNSDDSTGRAVDEDRAPLARMKHHVRGVLANLGTAAPCLSLGNQKLPKITVLHHDADVSFNCSFIDSPSAAWDSASFSSFETDDDRPVYCTPTLEDGVPRTAGGGFQEMSSRCNYLPADGWDPTPIPRTSSIAKAKRPSVSFAEGTRFTPGQRRTSVAPSGEEPAAQPPRKRKLSWRLSRLLPAAETPSPRDPSPQENLYSRDPCSPQDPSSPDPSSPRDPSSSSFPSPSTSAGRVKQGAVAAAPGGCGGSARGWSRVPVDGVVTGTVQAMLKRFGSFQRQRGSPRLERGTRAPGSPSPPGAPSSPSGTLSKKPLIPTTPVLRKLVATVAEGGAGLGAVGAGGGGESPAGARQPKTDPTPTPPNILPLTSPAPNPPPPPNTLPPT